MRVLGALLAVPTMVGLAARAYGDPVDGFDDTGFLATVRDAGINYTSSDRAIAFGKAVCGWIGNGKSGPELVGDLQRNNPGLTMDHATLFLAISAKYYCPQQLTKDPQPAAVGVLAASGHLAFTLIGTGMVVAIHLFGRPLGRLIDHDNTVEEDESLQPYLVQVVCRPKSEKYARAQVVQHASSNDITLRGIHTGHAADDEITLSAHLLMEGHTLAKLERLVAELSLQPGVRAVQWYAGDKAQQSE